MDNLVFQYFIKGGWVMWPILVTSLVCVSVIFERTIWWLVERTKREPEKLDKIYAAVQHGDLKGASALSRGSEDPVVRVLWHGLNHFNSSLQGALQVSAGIEIERAGRFIVVMDTIVTLAPLLGLLGTVTGLMKAFFKLGSSELSEAAITGGIAEALIATTCGLAIAIIALVALNFFSSKVARLEFEIQTACTNLEIMYGSSRKEVLDENRIAAAA